MGYTALHLAAAGLHQRNVEVVKMLLEAGADIDATDDDGHTPLMGAVVNGCVAIAEVLHNTECSNSTRHPQSEPHTPPSTLNLNSMVNGCVTIGAAGGGGRYGSCF